VCSAVVLHCFADRRKVHSKGLGASKPVPFCYWIVMRDFSIFTFQKQFKAKARGYWDFALDLHPTSASNL
jgi:hypothetical protein